jgi:hypothetical protein
MRSVDQQVQDVLEPGRFAQTCQHNQAPGPHTVDIPGRPLKAFATFVTVADLHAYSAEGQSLVLGAAGFSAPVAVERETTMGFMRGTTLLDPPNSEAERRRLLGGTIDLFAMTFLVGAAKAFQTEILTVRRGGPPPDQSQGGAQGGRIMSVAPEELVASARDGWLANPNLHVPRRDPLVTPRFGNTSDPGGVGIMRELNRVSQPSERVSFEF